MRNTVDNKIILVVLAMWGAACLFAQALHYWSLFAHWLAR